MKLTEEQIEKAAEAICNSPASHPRWHTMREVDKQQYRDAMIVAAPHLQVAPAQLSGDVIEAMLDVYGRTYMLSSSAEESSKRKGMTAAAQVLLERVLGPVLNRELPRFWQNDGPWRDEVNKILSRRHNSLLKPAEPTLEEEIRFYLVNSLETDLVIQAKEIASIVIRRAGGSDVK